MIQDALFLARMDLRLMFRSWATWLWAFAMPVLFFYFIGTVTGGARRQPARESVAVLVPADAGFLAGQLVRRLEQRDYHVIRAQSEEELSRHRRRLRLPAGFTDSVLAGRQVAIKLERDGGGLDADYDQVRINRAVYTVLADLIALSRRSGAPTTESFEELAREPRNLTLAVESAGVRITPPSGFQQSVPGNLVMFIMLVMFTSGSVTLTLERNQGILRRLASSPIARLGVVAGKWGARMALGMVQIAFAMLAGTVLFRVDWGRIRRLSSWCWPATPRWPRQPECCWVTSAAPRDRRSDSAWLQATSWRRWAVAGGRSRSPPDGHRSWPCCCRPDGRWTRCTGS